jgi:hypothetical protein
MRYGSDLCSGFLMAQCLENPVFAKTNVMPFVSTSIVKRISFTTSKRWFSRFLQLIKREKMRFATTP